MSETKRNHFRVVTEAAIGRTGSQLARVLDEGACGKHLARIAQDHSERVKRGGRYVRVIEEIVADETSRWRAVHPSVSPLESGRPLMENGPFSNWRRFPPERLDPHPVELGFSVKDIRTKVRCGADQILGWFPSREGSTF